MGKSEKRAINSNLLVLLMHLLKYRYQSEKRSNSWLFTILEHRKSIQDSLEISPSLRAYYYRELAAETGLSIDLFPKTPTFSPELD